MATRITYGIWRLRPSRFSKSRLKQLDLLRKARGLGLLNYPLFRNDPHANQREAALEVFSSLGETSVPMTVVGSRYSLTHRN
jgi:hypothetical protein